MLDLRLSPATVQWYKERLKDHIIHCKYKQCTICERWKRRTFLYKYPVLGRLIFKESFSENLRHDSLKLLRSTSNDRVDDTDGFNRVASWLKAKVGFSVTSLTRVAQYVLLNDDVTTDRRHEILRDPNRIQTTTEFAHCVIARLQPWSVATATLFPDETHARAIQLLYLGYQVGNGELLDVWRSHIIPFALDCALHTLDAVLSRTHKL